MVRRAPSLLLHASALHMTLRARLTLGLVIIGVVLVVPLVVAHKAMRKLHVDVLELRERDFAASIVLGNLRDALGHVRAREIGLGALRSQSEYDQLRSDIAHAHTLADSLVRVTADTGSASRDTFALRILSRLQIVSGAATREFELLQAGRDAEADTISDQEIAPAMQMAERSISPLERRLRDRTSERVVSADRSLRDAEKLSLAALAIALGLATIIALWLMRSISGPVTALEKGLKAVADGDLDHRLDISTDRRDEFGRLAVSFGAMSSQLVELDKLKAEFVSVASHELKTPINVILGYLQLMQEGIYGPLSTKQEEVLGTVEAQGRTLARLASHLLDVTRFEAGGGRIEPRSVRLVAMLDDMERAFHVLAVQRGIDFRVTLQDGIPAEVQWDVDRINEVMGNLLANAFKFTSSGGTVELVAAPGDELVIIEVRDTGAGIPPTQLPHIFEKFYQADNQRSASAAGSGLGLAIAKEIVEAHFGSIRCESALGQGTTFTLQLPVVVSSRHRTGSHRTLQLETVS